MAETSSQDAALGERRRQIRKGTQSCWECKRRKVRCIFVLNHTTCNHCRRRGTTCIGQEYPNKPVSSNDDQIESRLTRIEDILERLVANDGTPHIRQPVSEAQLESNSALGTALGTRGDRDESRQGIDTVVSISIIPT